MADSDGYTGGFTFTDTGSGEATGAISPDDLSGGGNGSDGSATGDDSTFDPVRHFSSDGTVSGAKLNADGTYRRKRARKSGGNASVNKPREKASAYSVDAVQGLLMNVHMALAAVTHASEMMLAPIEANNLARAIVDLQKLYPHTVFSPKVAAWLNLGMAAGFIYGPRLIMIRQRVRAEQAQPVNNEEPFIDMTNILRPGQSPGVQ